MGKNSKFQFLSYRNVIYLKRKLEHVEFNLNSNKIQKKYDFIYNKTSQLHNRFFSRGCSKREESEPELGKSGSHLAMFPHPFKTIANMEATGNSLNATTISLYRQDLKDPVLL